jgi:4-hydroxyphenylpyruvate dioxygenase-like putative hemolysin
MAPNTEFDLQPASSLPHVPNNEEQCTVQVSFSHVHLYVDQVEDVAVYKQLEDKLNKGDVAVHNDITQEDVSFVAQNRDIVKQLLCGFGFRVTGARMNPTTSNTQSVLVTSKDPNGVQFVVTSVNPDSTVERDEISLFDAKNVKQFYEAHAGRQGIAVLGFQANSVDKIQAQYRKFHPQLIRESVVTFQNSKVLQVYAYYKGDSSDSGVDTGTVLRFVEPVGENKETCLLPGLEPLAAEFNEESQAAYCDHWVSNVHSRTGFLKTLEDTLGFNPKVDFNAGVVAAGEAQIESTVTGNTSTQLVSDKEAALKDQSQVYLPINNALSNVGHVHGFLQELGQGIQHIASRVENLTDFVQKGNDNRKKLGEGFTFLRIPRSYYGTLSMKQLTGTESDCAGVSDTCANAITKVCEKHGVVSVDGAVDLEITREAIDEFLCCELKGDELKEYISHEAAVLNAILLSRYVNLYKLLRHHLSEESYLGLVRNQILVDVQGDDLLYQIFTSNILQRNVGEESPFLEFIQRVCSECTDDDGCPMKIKPGCGGFGIRNFLTLFLSIEVSKAMMEVAEAKAAGDNDRCAYAQAMVDCFTDQLNESNPILTAISDAMTEEGHCRDKMESASTEEDTQLWRERMEEAAAAKQAGNEKLMECSSKYKNLMKAIRESRS